MAARLQGNAATAVVHAEIDQEHASDMDDSSVEAEGEQSQLAESDEEPDSASDGDSGESDDEGNIQDTMPDSDVPATAVRLLLNNACRGVERKLASMVRKYSGDRYSEIERRQAQQKGGGAAKRIRRRQRRHPRVQLQFHLALVAPDGRVRIHLSEGMENNPQVERATLLLAAALEHMVQGQQLDIHTASARAALPQQPPRCAPQRQVGSMPQRAILADRNISSSRPPANKPPSVVAKETAREVFRRCVRPLQQPVLADGIADMQAIKLDVCGGNTWKACRETSCGCQQRCAALRCKTGWPADLPCVDPNNKDTNVDTSWVKAFLQFATRAGWHAEPMQASQAAR